MQQITQIIDSAYEQMESHFDETLVKQVLHDLLINTDCFFSAKPSFIGIGGPPGVGKSTYAYKKYKGDFFMIDVDEYRKFHPKYLTLNSSNVISKTSEFALYIGELLIIILTQLSCNIVYISTFSRFTLWDIFFKTHQKCFDNYSKRLIVLFAPSEVCFQAMRYRHRQEMESSRNTIPRPADKVFLIEQCFKLKTAISFYLEHKTFDNISFLYRPNMTSSFIPVDHDYFTYII